MKLFFGRYTYSAFLIPFLTLALVYFSANQAIQQVLDIRRLSLEAVSDWYLLYHLTGKRFQFLDDDTAKNSHTWLQALNDFELVMQNLAETPLQWLLDDQTRQDIQASYKVWDFTRQNILDSDQVYCQMVASPIGQALLQADLAQLAEAALTGVAPGSFTPGDLWQFYQLQDRLAELEVSSSIFTSYLERIEQAVERRVLLLNLVISAIALLISGVVIASTWRLFAITSAERERYVAEIEARNHALAHEVADRRLAEENLRLTLHSIGDGVIVTDQQGRVTRMNPVAEQLCGWPLAEAQGHCLSDVFQIVNAETRQAAENPVQRVLQEGVVVGLANHTMLIARDGRERQIADSAAPIFSVSGDLAGVVMVFRDVTEAYAMQREMEDRQAKLSSIFRVAPVGIGVVINRIFSEVNDTLCAMIGYRRDELVGQSARMIYPTQEDYEYVGQVKYDQIRHRGTGIVETRWQHKDGRI
jgi:PAS domain S-box-containing protein